MLVRGLIAAILGLTIWLTAGCGRDAVGEVEVYQVRRGEFRNSLTVTGDLEAVSSQEIFAPQLSWSMGFPKIAEIVEDGQPVKQGDLLVKFDEAEVQKAISDARNELEIAQAELNKAKANHRSELSGLVADVELARIGQEISQLTLEQADFKAEIERKKIELDLEKAKLQLEQARQEVENRRKVQAGELSRLELRVHQARTKLEQAEQTLQSLTITAPTPGIAIVRESHLTDEKFQVNDQAFPGWALIGLPDLSRMKAEVEVNEVDIARVVEGQEAIVRLDAYPDTSFPGRVGEIAVLARNRNRDSNVKVFDVDVLLEGSDQRLMPGMTVKCEIVIDRLADTLSIPLAAIFLREGRPVVYVRNGSGFEAREVVTGTENDNFAIIAEGLEEGEEVALADPTLKPESADSAAAAAGKEPKP